MTRSRPGPSVVFASSAAGSGVGCTVAAFASDGVCVPSEAVWAAGACESLGDDCSAPAHAASTSVAAINDGQ